MDIAIMMHLAAHNRSPSSRAHARLCLAMGGGAQTFLREALELFLINPVGLVLVPVHGFGGARHHDIIFQNPAGLPVPVAPLLRTRRGLKKEYPGRPRFFVRREDAEYKDAAEIDLVFLGVQMPQAAE